mmetsp:Transcript_58348/g.126740  ORF Transcript_58348/g.126740 Transcript_58348/m.126740 type:complete len:202 (+) Transcript_58348:203-808(+)
MASELASHYPPGKSVAKKTASLKELLVDDVERRELQSKALVTKLDVRVDRLDALVVRRLCNLLPLGLIDLLGSTDEAEEAAAALGALRRHLQLAARLPETVDGLVHLERLLGDGLSAPRRRPELHRAEDAVDRAFLLERLLDARPVARRDRLLQPRRPEVAAALDARHVARVRLLPCHQSALCKRRHRDRRERQREGSCHG